MLFTDICIESIIHHLPNEVISSSLLEEKLTPVYENLKLPLGRLEMFTGIQERRFWPPGTLPSDVASHAGRLALQESGVPAEDIGLLIHTSVCRDFLEPSTASVVHEKLGLSNDTLIFDVSNACLGFLNGMVIAGNMLQNSMIKAALIVAGEIARPLVESTITALLEDKSLTRKSMKGSFASLTIGSGAAAAVLVKESDSRSKHILLGGAYLVSSDFNHLCRGGNSGQDSGIHNQSMLLMDTDSERLLEAGCALAARTWEKTKRTLAFENDDIKCFFTHQVGSAHRKVLYESLKVNIEKDYPTYHYLGNMGSVSLPATLSIGAREGVIQEGDTIALLGIGSGINCLMLGVRW